jgi:hypothetical protein
MQYQLTAPKREPRVEFTVDNAVAVSKQLSFFNNISISTRNSVEKHCGHAFAKRLFTYFTKMFFSIGYGALVRILSMAFLRTFFCPSPITTITCLTANIVDYFFEKLFVIFILFFAIKLLVKPLTANTLTAKYFSAEL